jgi:hypothetical protein
MCILKVFELFVRGVCIRINDIFLSHYYCLYVSVCFFCFGHGDIQESSSLRQHPISKQTNLTN